MPIDRLYASEQMNFWIQSGMRSLAEIERIVLEDCFRPEDVASDDEKWVGEEVRRLWAAKLADEKNWPLLTDWDRLDAAFTVLRDGGIIALHDAGMTLSEGLTEVSEEYHAAGAEDSGAVGYCYYHWQDIEIAIKGHGLMLAFGDIAGDPLQGVGIGRRVVAAVEQAGFTTSWNGEVDRRIEISEFVWRKRYRPRRLRL